jgi:hypothetical protein
MIIPSERSNAGEKCSPTFNSHPSYLKLIQKIISKCLISIKKRMTRKFVDLTQFQSRNMSKDGNIDFGYWFDKTPEERLIGAARMIEVTFKEPDFLKTKVDRTIFSYRKHVNLTQLSNSL